METSVIPDEVPLERLDVSTYTIPTEEPESDGTCTWTSTTMVLVEVEAAGQTGIGYTYDDIAAAVLIRSRFAALLAGCDALDIESAWWRMIRDVRNVGRPGIASCAISAVDNALWDLKARILGLPLVRLLGKVRDEVDVYGSGGFTSYGDSRLREQLGSWSADGFRRVKMKIGDDVDLALRRVGAAREAIGSDCALFTDANGALTRKKALDFAMRSLDYRVSWLEEPVSSDDLDGLRYLRDAAPAPVEISAGEYGYDHYYFRRMLQHQSVDVLQADATRCCGISGFMRAAVLSESFGVPLSSHCAPAMHLHAACAAAPLIHLEYFHDHARIESMLFDGFRAASGGRMAPDLSSPGHGLVFKRADAAQFAH